MARLLVLVSLVLSQLSATLSKRLEPVNVGGYPDVDTVYIDPKTGKEPTFRQKWVVSTKLINGDCNLDRPSAVVNGQLPGPVITVKEGTRVLIELHNQQEEPITIHWHGITQRNSQWHDGVGAVTQCDIMKGQKYLYNFTTEGHSGTMWWHSHVLANRNTVMGGLNVIPRRWNVPGQIRKKPPVPIAGSQTILISDWYELSSKEMVEGQVGYPYQGWPLPDTLFVNGRTRLMCQAMWEFTVKPRKWYHLRVTNGALYATLNFIVQFHDIFTYEGETGYYKVSRFSSYDIMSGQSHGFLIFTNQKPGAYWIGARPRYDVEGYGGSPGLGIMRYEGIPKKKIPRGRGVYVGPSVARNRYFTWGQLMKSKGAAAPPKWINNPTKFIMLEMNMHNVKNDKGQTVSRYSWNNATLQLPTTWSPLLAEYEGKLNKMNKGFTPDVPPPGHYWAKKQKTSKVGFGVIDIPFNSVVHMVFQGHEPPGLNHPIHVHGMNFFVVGHGFGRFDPTKWKNGYKYNLENPVDRNTAWLLEGGWTAIRFKADNPGVWLMHCHLEPHVEGGMAAVFTVRNNKLKNGGIPHPPQDYPKCTGAGH